MVREGGEEGGEGGGISEGWVLCMVHLFTACFVALLQCLVFRL